MNASHEGQWLSFPRVGHYGAVCHVTVLQGQFDRTMRKLSATSPSWMS